MSVYSFIESFIQPNNEIPLSVVAADVAEGKISTITVNGDSLDLIYADTTTKTSRKDPSAGLPETLATYGVTPAELAKVSITIQGQSGFQFWFITLAPIVLPLLFIIFIFWFLSRQVKGAGMQAFSFGQSKARVIDPADSSQRVTFTDIAGAREAKEELLEIVDFLKSPKKFLDIGARIPKGIILMGAPGTGKTLLARAVAGEAGVPFFSISGSEFVEMFVGVGASRVRDLFQLAKKAAPAIIFVDEIDAVGRVRGTGVGGGNDEREQTLNQILVEMDGFEPTEKVVVMAATNRPDVLDPALLRPGRFDRRVTIDLPDRRDREEILKIHARQKPLRPDVMLAVIAERTPGFSGAELYSLMNEGAILAARENRKEVTQYDLIRSIEKVMLGPERKSHLLSKKEKELTAYHEAGHALVSSILLNADPVHKISIISRGRAAGYTLKLPFEDKKMFSRKQFLDDITATLGGYVAEKMLFDDVTTGPSNDLTVVTAIARDMVSRYGMSEKLGPISFGERQLGNEPYSEKVAAQIDAEVSRIIDEARARAIVVINEHRVALDAIAKELIEKETIERSEFEKILIANGITPKKRDEDQSVVV
ncbi:cell division protein FtsH [Candidatus Kaiserbacteria bacterium CG_4_9_14_3_um_filter_50_16]|uniref:ATP-dependent zinc metalloprotease FtsH n=1 Tax=Candidatus Kaiserbacteria bacterium CG08_land_8_20_14_0_20_50_21 TaxID=1974604 RepID=A0A2H0YXT8_9BACT|nr:MAG: cell division protein FtsH [Candidatus Kaiserbacteria bacterium CG08_land_8_20_14_0_20_50_21]PIW96457.1 MAG: cell division protein FtsH [Candidatus Kaiserbacteria bacterium CG_4_8_14_3_um_filter_50_23]PJA94423.1 MAG: cell division protein FtsH [Candidatus Kaiserbacteria bacterium CG_4_9_14_3_um_filter_50_16]